MSRLGLAPIPVGIVPITVSLGGQLTNLSGVKAGNESDSTLFWQWGGQAGYLYPSEVDVLKWDGQAPPQIIFTPTTVLPQSLAVTRNLLIEFAYLPDSFPGDWPQQMSRLTQTAANIVVLKVNPGDSGIYTQAPNVNVVNRVFPLQPGTQSVRFTINQIPSPPTVTWTSQSIVGNNSNTLYFASTNTGNNGGFDIAFKLHPVDTALLFSMNTAGSANTVQYELDANLGFAVMDVRLASGGTEDLTFVPVNISGHTVAGLPHKKPYDWSVTSTWATSGTPSVGQAKLGNGLVVDFISASVITVAGASVTPQIQLVDSTGPTTLWRNWMAVGTAGVDRDKINLIDLGYEPAGAITLQWDRAIAANTFATLDLAGYTL